MKIDDRSSCKMAGRQVTNEDLVAFMHAMKTENKNLAGILSAEIKSGREQMKKNSLE